MIELLMGIHIAVSLFLILVIMMQGSKSEGLSGLFGGGGSGTLFGTGTRTFLAKLTTVLGIAFMVICISLTIFFSRRSPSIVEKSVMGREESMPDSADSNLP